MASACGVLARAEVRLYQEHIAQLQAPYQKWFGDAFSKYFIWLQVVVHNKVIWSIWAIYIPVNDLVVMQILAAQQDLDINVEFNAYTWGTFLTYKCVTSRLERYFFKDTSDMYTILGKYRQTYTIYDIFEEPHFLF